MSIANPAAVAAALKGDWKNATVASTPGGIERQEKEGQTALVASTNMPIEIRPSREAFEKIGFVFGEPIDDVFCSATLPAGWTRKATAHSMHSVILDDKGRERVSVFYKAAFYDRRADARLICRYTTATTYPADDGPHSVGICDAGKVIIQCGSVPSGRAHMDALNELKEKARATLAREWPHYADPLAYWSDP